MTTAGSVENPSEGTFTSREKMAVELKLLSENKENL
jgi:hypothetical protein